jgi:hypothetical protein
LPGQRLLHRVGRRGQDQWPITVGIAMGAVKHLRERRVKQRLLKSI